LSDGGAATVRFHADASFRRWDTETYEYLESFDAFFPAARQFVPWRAMADQTETWIEDTASGQPVAWFPYALDRLTANPQGRAWAGAIANYLGVVALEGGYCRDMTPRHCEENPTGVRMLEGVGIRFRPGAGVRRTSGRVPGGDPWLRRCGGHHQRCESSGAWRAVVRAS